MIQKDTRINEMDAEELACKLMNIDEMEYSGSQIQEMFEKQSSLKFEDFVEFLKILEFKRLINWQV